MTIAEIKYSEYVSSFVGIPFKRHSWNREDGVDCRTIVVLFLVGLGYDIDGDDGLEMPGVEEMEEIESSKEKTKEFLARYIRGVKSKGEVVAYDDLQRNDIVLYESGRLPHLGVCVGNDRLLTAAKDHGSLQLKLSMLKDAIIVIVRPKKEES